MDLDKLLDKIISTSFFALFIIVPLIFTPYNFELFEFNKMLTVYFFTIIISTTWLIKCLIHQKLLLKKTPFDLPLILFFISQLISTIISIDPHTSIWGYYSRFHGGLISTFSYLILYYAFTTFMKKNLKTSLELVFTTALIVSLYGIFEHFGIDKHIWVQDVQNRVFSTLGQPNWLAAYLIALIPVSLSFYLNSKNSRGLYYLFLSLVFYLTLLYTKSRSGLLGLAVGLSIFGILYLFKNFKKVNFKKLFVSIILFISITLITGTDFTPKLTDLINHQPSTSATAPADQNKPAPSSITLGGSSSADIRKVVWQGALAIFKHYPIFGSGVETFAYSYYNFRPQTHNLLSEWDFLYNKAHNEFLNFLSTTGAFGLLSYSLIILWYLVWSIINLKKSNYLLNLSLLSGFLALSVSNFFGFSVVPTALFFFLFPAFSYLNTLKKSLKKPSTQTYLILKNADYLKITIITFLGLFLLGQTLKTWQADKIFALGKNQLDQNLVQEGFDNLQKAVDLRPQEPLYRNELAEAKAKLAVVYDQQLTQIPETATLEQKTQLITQLNAQKQLLINQAIKDSDTVISQNRVHLNYYKSRIKIFLLLSSIDKNYLNQALEATQQAIALSPTDAKLYYNLSLIYSKIGQTGLAEQTLLQSIDLKPNYETARYTLGSLYEQTNQPQKAKDQYLYILKNLNPDNQTVQEKLQNL